MFARPSTGPLMFRRTARSRRRSMAAASARTGSSAAVLAHRLLLLARVTHYQTVALLSGNVNTVSPLIVIVVDTDHGREKRDGRPTPPSTSPPTSSATASCPPSPPPSA